MVSALYFHCLSYWYEATCLQYIKACIINGGMLFVMIGTSATFTELSAVLNIPETVLIFCKQRVQLIVYAFNEF